MIAIFYIQCFGDTYYETLSTKNSIRIHASSFSSGEAGLVVVNISDKEEIVEIELKNLSKMTNAGVFEIYNDNPISRKTGINGIYTTENAGGPENFKKIEAYRIDLSNNKIKIISKPFSANYILTNK